MIEEDKFVHYTIEEITTPNEGDIVKKNRYWTQNKEGYVSIYVGKQHKKNPFGRYRTWSPQCNTHKRLAEQMGNYEPIFIETAFVPDLGVYE